MDNSKSTFVIKICLLAITIFSCERQVTDLSKFTDPANLPMLKDAKMIQVSSYDTTGGNNDRINIHTGEKAEIFNVEGPGMISRIWITIDSRDPDYLRRITLRMYWDDETEPSVEVPVGDFFGNAFEYKHFTSRNLGMSSGGYYCYFPMPFQKNARIEVKNDTDQEVFAFYYHINYFKFEKPLDKNTAYFHAYWKRDLRTDYEGNFEALNARGQGHFVGLNFNAQPYTGSLFYLEGDEMIYVDGEEFPSTYGTGMEDYFTSGWYFKNGEFDADFHGLIFKDDATGRVSAYRHHIPDFIPFEKSIDVTFEHGHGNEQEVDMSTTSFWYQLEPHNTFPEMPPPALRKPLVRPVPAGAYEAENTEVEGVTFEIEDMSSHGPDWSGMKQLHISGEKSAEFSITLNGMRESKYHIDLYATRGPDYGIVEISSDGRYLYEFDGYNEEIVPNGKFRLTDLNTAGGNLVLNFKVSGKHPDSKGFDAGLDAFVLVPDRNYIPEWYMIGPFPNKRLSDYERMGLDSIFPPEIEIDLEATYTGAENQEIVWERVDGRDGGYGMALWQKYDPYEFVVCYALTYVYSPVEQSVQLMFSSDDGAKVFLNDEQLYRFLEVRIAQPDDEEIRLDLKPGWNKLLLKVENNFGGYAFFARVIDKNENLKFSVDRSLN